MAIKILSLLIKQSKIPKTMIRLLLIIVLLTQLGCASVFWQTLSGTVIGSATAEVIKHELDKDDEETPQP